MANLQCSISTSLLAALETASKEANQTIDYLVAQALSQYLKIDLHTLFQVSTSGALVAGIYQGAVSTEELLRHGNFGLGTFEGLDGEMVVLDGSIYHVFGDGTVHVARENVSIPFAAVLPFTASDSFELDKDCTIQDLRAACDAHRMSENLFYAFRIDGSFRTVHTRAMRPAKEHTPLIEAAAVQPEFHYKDISGTIVGFWSPGYATAFNVPGYHFHFISDDRTKGGHLLDFQGGPLKAQVDSVRGYYVALPDSGDFLQAELPKDPTADLSKAE
jgi:acetolactate decarboxylase